MSHHLRQSSMKTAGSRHGGREGAACRGGGFRGVKVKEHKSWRAWR